MGRTKSLLKLAAIASLIAAGSFSGCTKRPSEEELAKLEQARAAAESAERKLAELRSERMQLEQTLEQKKQELGQHEMERDELREKMNQREAGQ